jgi:hypothetical protein
LRFKLKSFSLLAAAALAVSGAALRSAAQSRAPKKNAPPAAGQSAPKKNAERPEDEDDDPSSASSPGGAQTPSKTDPNATRYVYEFSQPDFYVYFIHIEHDDSGHGTIRFERRSDTEQITDPIEISPAALGRIRAHWTALNFLDSTENYQGPRTYPSQGKTKLTLRRGGRERTTEFNYSQNADAEGLADEYRRAAEQAVLVFDVNVALEAQPLDTPRLIENIESLMDSNMISDKQQLVPLLRSLSEDERVPLVGRNHALRILKKLEKEKPGK